jgi:tripartite-type tricarboxylate transporter receptor subunit TctC
MPRVIVAALAALLLLSHTEVQAQAYPSKPIRFVIPFGAGSATDALARIIGQDLEQSLGQPIIVVQKPGADGALAAGEVKRAAPDGYTLLFGTNSPLAVAPNMQKDPPYNVLTDFTPITFLGENSFFLVVHPSVPANSLAELIAVAKASPKPLNYAAGNTYAFVSMAMLAARNKIELEAIRYKSEPDAIADLLSGRVQVMNGTATSVAAHVKAGKLKALALTSDGRAATLPDVPSMGEAGVKDLVVYSWQSAAAPKGLPGPVKARLEADFVASANAPDIKAKFEAIGFDVVASNGEQFAKFLASEIARWKAVVEAGKISAE